MLKHISILAQTYGTTPSVFDILKAKPGERVLDVTLGLGGHARIFLEQVTATGHLTGLDADKENLQVATANFGAAKNIDLHHLNFLELTNELGEFDIIFGDLGLSSPHLDEHARGFTFRDPGAPLDMRFNRTAGPTAADVLNRYTLHELAEVFRIGEVEYPGKLASICIEKRAEQPFVSAEHLITACTQAYNYKAQHHLPVVFQALRLEVNREFAALEHLLNTAPSMLRPGGRLGIISFHSLEDRLVKQAFRELCTDIKDQVTGAVAVPSLFVSLTKKPLAPSVEEIECNPRSRSAKFRAIQKR